MGTLLLDATVKAVWCGFVPIGSHGASTDVHASSTVGGMPKTYANGGTVDMTAHHRIRTAVTARVRTLRAMNHADHSGVAR